MKSEGKRKKSGRWGEESETLEEEKREEVRNNEGNVKEKEGKEM